MMSLQSKLEVALHCAECFAKHSKSIVGSIAWFADGHTLEQSMAYSDGQPFDAVDRLARQVSQIEVALKVAKSVAPQCNSILTEANIELAKLSSVRPGLHVAGKRFNHAHETLLSVASSLSIGLRVWDDNPLTSTSENPIAIDVEKLRANFYDACRYLAQQPFMLEVAEFDELIANAKQENALACRWDCERDEFASANTEGEPDDEPDGPKLPEVDLDLNQVRYAGECHNVTGDQALLFSELAKSYPEHIAASDFFGKPSRVKDSLPDALKALVRTSGGYRLDLG